MPKLLALAVVAVAVQVVTVAEAGDERFVTRSPSGAHSYDLFQDNQRIGTIRPDALGKPRIEGPSPQEQSRYTIQRSPSAPNAYEILRDGQRIGSVISPPPSRAEPPKMPPPASDHLELPGASRDRLDLDRLGPAIDRGH